MPRGTHAVLLALLMMACGHRISRTKTPGPRLPESRARLRTPPPPPEWFWQPTYAEVRPSGKKPLDLPVSDVDRLEGAGRVWDELSAEARERLEKDGVLVIATESSRSMGGFYTDLRDQRVPHVITLDALFYLVHLGIERALAELDELELVPALSTLLEKLDTRLGREETGASTELAEAYRIARGIVAVARALESARPPPGGELGAFVADEKARIEAHAGPGASTLLGVTLDYASFAPPKGAAHPASYRALAWLSSAPLGMVARSEAKGSVLGIARARTNTRAAMLLARVCDREIDASIHAAYGRVLRLLAFVWGAPDDLALTELDEIADAVGVDLTKPQNVANVVRVDRVRGRAAAGRSPVLSDGLGTGRGAIGVRMFGGHASPDAVALQLLAGKKLPSTLDVAAWLGVPGARALAREGRDSSFDETLTKVQEAAPIGMAIHASVHGSLLEALASWARTEDAAGFSDEAAVDQRGGWGIPRTSARERARIESVLAAWTFLRHSGEPLSRPSPPATTPTRELRVAGAPLPVFVEPLPDAIARLVSTARQLRRGLESRLGPGSGAMTALAEMEDMLTVALKAAERHASDEASTPEEATQLAALPARLARMEEDSGTVPGPVSATVHGDVAGKRRLVSATGRIEPVLMLARAPERDAPMLVVGAHLSAQELVETGGKRTATKRPTWTASFRWSR